VKLKRTSDFDIALAALREIKNRYPSAIIAGGAIRDLTLGSYVKDFDIFVHAGDNHEKRSAQFYDPYHWEQLTKPAKPVSSSRQKGAFIGDRISRAPQAASKTTDSPGVKGVIKFDLTYDITLDIIITNVPPIEYVEEYFDLGICKTYTDGSKVHYSADFMSDVNNKRITILGKHMTYNEIKRCQVDHIMRVRDKYPHFTPHNAPHIKKILDDTECRQTKSIK